MILQRVTPVTHSVGNCLKRVIVIVASVIVFKNPMSRQNMIGELSSYSSCQTAAVSGMTCTAVCQQYRSPVKCLHSQESHI